MALRVRGKVARLLSYVSCVPCRTYLLTVHATCGTDPPSETRSVDRLLSYVSCRVVGTCHVCTLLCFTDGSCCCVACCPAWWAGRVAAVLHVLTSDTSQGGWVPGWETQCNAEGTCLYLCTDSAPRQPSYSKLGRLPRAASILPSIHTLHPCITRP